MAAGAGGGRRGGAAHVRGPWGVAWYGGAAVAEGGARHGQWAGMIGGVVARTTRHSLTPGMYDVYESGARGVRCGETLISQTLTARP